MRWRDVKQNRVPEKPQNTKLNHSLPYALRLDKIKAFITDTFLLVLPVIFIVFYLVMGDRESFQSNMLEGWIYIVVPVGIIVTFFYIFAGQTPGMKAYDMRIIDNKTGKKPGIILAILRLFFFNIVLFSVVGLFLSLLREDKRGIHDLLSGTSIIKTTL